MPITRTTTEHTIRQNPQAIHHRIPDPLDSGLRRAAKGVLPSRRIQDFLSINDDRVSAPACVRHQQAGIMTEGAALRGRGINRIMRAKASLTLIGNTAFDIVREFALFDFSQKRAGDGLDGFAERRVLL